MKKLLALFLSGSLVAQEMVISNPSSCEKSDGSSFELLWTFGPPCPSVGGLELFLLSGVGQNELSSLIICDESSLSEPIQVGLIWPDMGGCLLGALAEVSIIALGGTFQVDFPPGFPIDRIFVQGLVLDNRPSGFSLSQNYLEYILN